MLLPRGRARYELVRGVLRTMPLQGFRHGELGARLLRSLQDSVRNDLGDVVAAGTGFMLGRDPDTVRAPSSGALIVPKRRPLTNDYVSGPPSLALEIIWDERGEGEVHDRLRDWCAAATPMVVVIDDRMRTATVHTPTATTQLSVDDAVDGGDVVPGWKLPLRELFE